MSNQITNNPLTLVKAGREAAKAIPGMPGQIIKGMFLNFGLFILVVATMNALLYFFLVGPINRWAQGMLPDTFDWFATSLSTILLGAAVMGSLYLAVRWSFNLMHLWYEALIEKILLHLRPQLLEHKTSGTWADVVVDMIKEFAIMIGLLLLNLIPAVGSILSFVWTAHRIGLSNYQPYNAVLRAHKLPDRRVPLKFLRPPTLIPGAAMLLVALIPFVGWLLLWWLAMHMVIGAAWLNAHHLPENLVEPDASRFCEELV